MKKNAIIASLSFCCIFVYSQPQLSFSKTFEAKKKNVVVALINNHPHYFHVLRYNKAAHDMTIERRDKPNAHIIAFTPLKLDSVNAGWFDYEKLDYLWYEADNKLCFVFEKVLNTKRTVYLKVIDTLGKSTGFIELSSLEAESGVSLKFTFSKGGGNTILVVGAMAYPNGITKKSAMLYDVKTFKPVWIKKLPHENSYKEITDGFTSNLQNDFFYIHYAIKSFFLFRRGPAEQLIINGYEDISLVKSHSLSKDIISHVLNLKNIEAVYAATLIPEGMDIIFAAQVVEQDFGNKAYLHLEKLNEDFSKVLYKHKHSLYPAIIEQLTFYDGSNYNDVAYKNYSLKKNFITSNALFFITERKDENYYKELLVWQTDLSTGLLKKMEIIPRKLFYFGSRTRFKKIQEPMLSLKNDSLRVYLLEDPGNLNRPVSPFNYRNFSKQTNLWGGNIVCYSSGATGSTVKRLVYSNRNFDLIPVPYSAGNFGDEVFYFNEGSYEKFGFISLKNP